MPVKLFGVLMNTWFGLAHPVVPGTDDLSPFCFMTDQVSAFWPMSFHEASD